MSDSAQYSVLPSVALAHDFLNQNGGAERVVEQIHQLFPTAPVYTSIYDRDRMPEAYRGWEIHPSFMQHLPGVMRHHQQYLPLYPLAMASFNCHRSVEVTTPEEPRGNAKSDRETAPNGFRKRTREFQPRPFCFGIFLPATRSRTARRSFSRSAGLSASSLRFSAPAMV